MEDRTVAIDLNIQQLNTVLVGLSKLSIEVGLDTFNNIQKQANEKLKPPQGAGPEGPLADKVLN